MKRHKWEKERLDLKNSFAKQEQCKNCKLFRFMALGIWRYSKEKTTDENPFVKEIQNPGCI